MSSSIRRSKRSLIRSTISSSARDPTRSTTGSTILPCRRSRRLRRREAVDVRLVRVGEPRAGTRDWRKELNVVKLPGLAPRLSWLPEIDHTLIKTWLKTALQAGEKEGQEFTLPSDP